MRGSFRAIRGCARHPGALSGCLGFAFCGGGEKVGRKAMNGTAFPASFPQQRRSVAPADPQYFLKVGKSMLAKSPFVDRTAKRKESFSGIGAPEGSGRRAVPIAGPLRSSNEQVDTVVNVTFGPEMFRGEPLRRFNVRYVNTRTGRAKYAWIAEDKVTDADVSRLLDLYRRHIESKLKVIPGL